MLYRLLYSYASSILCQLALSVYINCPSSYEIHDLSLVPFSGVVFNRYYFWMVKKRDKKWASLLESENHLLRNPCACALAGHKAQMLKGGLHKTDRETDIDVESGGGGVDAGAVFRRGGSDVYGEASVREGNFALVVGQENRDGDAGNIDVAVRSRRVVVTTTWMVQRNCGESGVTSGGRSG